MKRTGFTLVELSIVLVILGLLIGGVLTGQSLIRAAELRSVTTQQARYVTAVQTFRDKYFALPGDMTNATSYWGLAASGTSCTTTASTDSKTCDGNGDGQVLLVTSPIPTTNESLRFWQHLANAGLIEGNYSGATLTGTYGYTAVGAGNSPSGRLNNGYWYVNYWGTQLANSALFDGEYGNAFEYGAMTASSHPYNAALKPEELYNIDKKLDDGQPATGMVIGRATFASNSCTDTTSSTNMAANYLLTSSVVGCTAIFRRAF